MLKRYTFWLWLTIVFMLLNAGIHSITLFISPAPQNETERQMVQLMTTYRNDFGAGFHPTPENLFTALSSCFSLLCLLGGLMNAYLIKKRVAAGIMRGVVLINLLVFTICFVMMAVFTFLPPIVLTGLIVLFLILALVSLLREPKVT
ncbi:MAG: LIC_13387 family protein [Pyrinomonadaceae bacterium]